MSYIYHYNNVREHSSVDYQTPFAYLNQKQPEIDDNLRHVQFFILDDVSVTLGPWSGYNAWHSTFTSKNLGACRFFLSSRSG